MNTDHAITKDEARRLIAAHKTAFYAKQNYVAALRLLLRLNDALDRTPDRQVQHLIGRYLERHVSTHENTGL